MKAGRMQIHAECFPVCCLQQKVIFIIYIIYRIRQGRFWAYSKFLTTSHVML